MARRSRTILDDLALLPWWVDVALAALDSLSFKSVIPSISFQNPFLKCISGALPSFARLAGGILLFFAGISAFNAWQKGYAITETGGVSADGGVGLVLRRGGEKLLVQSKHWRMDNTIFYKVLPAYMTFYDI